MSLLEKGSRLPALGCAGFTLSSYNVLLPNSSDGWWIYKYYQQHVSAEQRTWEHRKKLTKANILGSGGGGADIVCVQETSADSFDADFDFMKEAGYDHVLHTKFRFRTATFFRRDKFDLKSDKHGDRTLTTLLTVKSDDAGTSARSIFVVNCHLTGGPSPEKRMRQVHDSTEYMRKEINKMAPAKAPAKKGAKLSEEAAVPAPPPPAVVVCGDFNEEGDTAVRMLLCEGLVPQGYTSAEGVVITNKDKRQEFGAFSDAHAAVYNAAATARPDTLICPNLDEHFLDASTVPPTPTLKLVEALRKAFYQLTGGKDSMGREAMEDWLVKINLQLNRGSEFRNSAAILEKKREAGEDEVLTFQDFQECYMSELREGKYWGVHHDLQQGLGCAVAGAGEGPSFRAVYDYIYFSPGLHVEGVREELTKDEFARALKGDDPLPNAWQPSDHVMQTAAFRFQ